MSHRNPRERTASQQKVNLYDILDPLFNLPDFVELYYGAMRNFDFTDGCSIQCPVCYVDAKPLEMYFDTDSVLRAFNDERFQRLMGRNMRVGVLSDPFDHPDVNPLTRAMLPSIEGYLSFNTSVPIGSEPEVIRMMASLKALDDYPSAGHPRMEMTQEGGKLGMYISVKPHNQMRIRRMLEGFMELKFNDNGIMVLEKYHMVVIIDYITSNVIDLGRVLGEYGERLISPDTHPEYFASKDTFPHTPETIHKGKFIIIPDGAFIVRNETSGKSSNGKQLIRITPDNYSDLALKYLINDPNPIYIPDYKDNPYFPRADVEPIPRTAVFGFKFK